MDVSVLAIIFAGLLFGLSSGVGVALAFEVIMRLSPDGRSIIVTWARTKTKNCDE